MSINSARYGAFFRMGNTFHVCQPADCLISFWLDAVWDWHLAGTREKCYASRPLGRNGILIFFEGELRDVWMNERDLQRQEEALIFQLFSGEVSKRSDAIF